MNKLLLCGMLVMNLSIVDAIPEYTYENGGLQIICPAVEFEQVSASIKKELEKLDPCFGEAYMPITDNILKNLKESSLSNEELISVSCDLCSISDFLSEEMRKRVMNACLNLLVRAALNGNTNAMYDLTSTSFAPDSDGVKDIIDIKGIDNLDYALLMNMLSQELKKRKTEGSFVAVIKDIKG